MTPKQKAEQFHRLHIPGTPLVLFNIWDAGSAKAVAASGAKALATGSWSVANANGYADGERIPLDFAIANLARIIGATDLPVSIDIESGYSDVAQSIERTIQAGAVGCNLEDSYPENGTLRPIEEQMKRIEVARKAATPEYFINARSDVYFHAAPDEKAFNEVLERARAYAGAGANGLFTPGLTEEKWIARLAESSPLPLNLMVAEKTPPLSTLAQLGVARVSHGPGPYLVAMQALEKAGREALL